MSKKLWMTLGLLVLTAVEIMIFAPLDTITAGVYGGRQLENSDAAYHTSTQVLNLLHLTRWLFPVLLVIGLCSIWWTEIKRFVTFLMASLTLCLFLVAIPDPSMAYYDKQDWPEPYIILPNETAFWVPDVGANKESQTKFNSDEYTMDMKVPLKRGNIAHTTLSGSGYLSNFVVPAGRLLIVNLLAGMDQEPEQGDGQ